MYLNLTCECPNSTLMKEPFFTGVCLFLSAKKKQIQTARLPQLSKTFSLFKSTLRLPWLFLKCFQDLLSCATDLSQQHPFSNSKTKTKKLKKLQLHAWPEVPFFFVCFSPVVDVRKKKIVSFSLCFSQAKNATKHLGKPSCSF